MHFMIQDIIRKKQKLKTLDEIKSKFKKKIKQQIFQQKYINYQVEKNREEFEDDHYLYIVNKNHKNKRVKVKGFLSNSNLKNY